ncbi:MAG: hypothetical protein U1F43_14920 [Myxococcota bacterium]
MELVEARDVRGLRRRPGAAPSLIMRRCMPPMMLALPVRLERLEARLEQEDAAGREQPVDLVEQALMVLAREVHEAVQVTTRS